MEIRNVMEDIVISMVEEICSEKESSEENEYCTSPECRQDVICYVLNRIPPKYVSSGRGLVHVESDFDENRQVKADIFTLITQGLKRITSVRRSYYDGECGECDDQEGFFYNLPTIKGRLLHGLTFEPVRDIQVTLYLGSDPVKMVDARWQNPFTIVGGTSGTFMFFPQPIRAENGGKEKNFDFEVRAEAPGFEELHHFFSHTAKAEERFYKSIQLNRELNLKDLYLLPQ
ncbi:MAG: late competence development ComFB family protein [Spirochaetia bacterium]